MQHYSMNANWKFYLGDCPDAWKKGFCDDTWQTVTLPHDWSVTRPFSKDYSSGTGYLIGGIGWYRKKFTHPTITSGQKAWLVFDGVYKNSQVWCNSYYLGKWPNGYTTFRYDVSDYLNPNGDNEIVVKVSHPDISDSRWFTGSGITRQVSLLISEKVYIAPDSVFFQTPQVTKDQATIYIENQVVNETDTAMEVVVSNSLKDTQGETVAHLSQIVLLPANGSLVVANTGPLLSPVLWQPDAPYLYTLSTQVDCPLTQHHPTAYTDLSVGIRSFYFDPDFGLLFNDQPLKLKGVCVHHDAGCLGAAVTAEVWLRRLLKLQEMGCNAIRMSHNPHMPQLYDLCDALGFLVIDEAFDEWEGVKNKWSTGHNVYPPKHQGYFEDFPEWHERDLKALIKRDRNHPSILMWSIGNEIDYPNDPYCHPMFDEMVGNNDKNKPKAEQLYNPNNPNAERLGVLAHRLAAIVKTEDTTRPVTAAIAFPELSIQIGYLDALDVVGYNYKEALYAEGRSAYPTKPFMGSENSHSLEAWKAVRDYADISGQFLWTGIDYLGETSGWPTHGSHAGHLLLSGFEKLNFYRRRSLWSTTPSLYLVTTPMNDQALEEYAPVYRQWQYTPGNHIHVRCYTALPEAILFCNDQEIGLGLYDDMTGYISWTLPYQEGRLSVVAQIPSANTGSSPYLTDHIDTCLAPSHIQLNRWLPPVQYAHLSQQLTVPESYLHQIEVTITDSHGRHSTNDATLLHVEIIGAGTLVGIENGDLSDSSEYGLPDRRAYEGHAIIYVRTNAPEDTFQVKVSGKGLMSATI